MVVFGGASSTGTVGDTWTWDGASWTQQTTASAPSPRSSAAAASLDDRLVLFGGVGPPPLYAPLDDTWTWDGSTWTQQSPQHVPPSRHYASAAEVAGKVVVFGGVDPSGNPLSDTWAWDGNDWTLQASTGPSGRSGAAQSSR
jgi:hypothetical protein